MLRADLVSAEDRTAPDRRACGALEPRRDAGRADRTAAALPGRGSTAAAAAHDAATGRRPAPRPDLEFFNGLGGFAADGREYVTILGAGQWTPAPWINVIANPAFGFQVSESGSGYTWSLNSRENQLTPWSNDPVSDPPGETIYVRDEDSGELWGPTVLPIREEVWPYMARHGQGYSRFEHTSHGVALDLLQFVPLEDPIKISRLTITNHSGRPRRLSVTAYVEWVLGVSRNASAPFVVTEIDPTTGPCSHATPGIASSLAVWPLPTSAGARARGQVIGRSFLGATAPPTIPQRSNGGPALRQGRRWPRPVRCLQTTIELRPGGRAEIVFCLGEAATTEEARTLIARYRTADLEGILRTVVQHWDDVLGAVQVTTPDRSMNILLNRWLLYQTLACRVWARGAFYQAGGAYGFRDQLQDVMALTVTQRDVARAQLLRAAARQFVEGDVQHWWHPPSGRGVRTRISDDLLWLPYAVIHYLEVTGDVGSSTRLCPSSTGRSSRPGRRVVLRATRVHPARDAVRTLRPRPRPQPGGREPWPAIDRHGRLERRDEPGRSGRARRASGSAGFCTPSSGSVRGWPMPAGSASAPRCGDCTSAAQGVARTRGVGWRVVSACLF